MKIVIHSITHFLILIALIVKGDDKKYDSNIGRMKILAPVRDEKKQVSKPIIISPMLIKDHVGKGKFKFQSKMQMHRNLAGVFPPFMFPPLFVPPKSYSEPMEKNYEITGASNKIEADENKLEFEFGKNFGDMQRAKEKYNELQDLVNNTSKAIKKLEGVYRNGMDELSQRIERVKNTQYT